MNAVETYEEVELRASSELSASEIVQRSDQGLKVLLARHVVTKLLTLASNIVLARFLSPSDFGTFGIAVFTVTMFSLLADGGLGAALLRLQRTPTEIQKHSLFWSQCVLSLSQILLVQLLAAPVAQFYKLSPDTVLIIRVISLGSVVSVFRTLPTILLEREFRFAEQASVEVWECLTYSVLTILLAINHFGVWSFALSSVMSQTVSVLLLFKITRYIPRFGYNWSEARALLKFGMQYQLGNVFIFLRDALNPCLVGFMLGPVSVGLINFATQTGAYANQLVAPFARLYFPIFCRAQSQPDLIQRACETAVRWNFVVVAGLTCIALPLLDVWVIHVFGEKWTPAVPILACVLVANTFGTLTGPVIALSNALNRSDLPMKISALTTILSWGLLIFTVKPMGIVCFGLIQIVSQLVQLSIVKKLEPICKIRVWHCVSRTAAVGVLSSLILLICRNTLHLSQCNIPALIVVSVVSLCVYSFVVNAIWGGIFWRELSAFVWRKYGATDHRAAI
ncbi:MAG TPA: oligosaccharide flippase family protein [Drouetiella sp.]